ncbi:MAG: hypothetical protein ABI668_00860 [Sphingorhabdus sp.]
MTPVAGETEILPIRLAAARFVAKVEQDGAAELDALTSNLFKAIRPRYLAWLITVGTGAALFLLAIAYALFAAFGGPQSGNIPMIALCIIALGWFALLAAWRWHQYGFGWARTPLTATYANTDSAIRKNIDLFFGVLQRDTKLRAFYYTRSGTKSHVRRQYFFGRLRVLMLSEHDWIREPVFAPTGLWFARELYIEADVTALIAQAHAKPKAGGRPKEIDYEAIMLRLIEHPSLKDIDPAKHGAETRIMELIRGICETGSASQPDLRVPEDTALRDFAKKFVAAMQQNRLS